MSNAFDIVTTLGTEATTLIAVVGGTIAAGLSVWVVSIGASIGVRKFASFAKKG